MLMGIAIDQLAPCMRRQRLALDSAPCLPMALIHRLHRLRVKLNLPARPTRLLQKVKRLAPDLKPIRQQSR
jgi:hypothetical protein